jgi:AcrR family transcriptional regulator
MTEHLNEDQRREQILDATMKLFVTKGFEQTTVEQIAHAAGLSKGAVYWYFKSKLEILFALTDRYVENGQMALLRTAEFDQFGAEALYKAHRYIYQDQLDHPESRLLFNQLMALSKRYPEITERLKEYNKGWEELATRLLDKGVELGIYHQIHTRNLAQAINGMWAGLSVHQQFDPEIDILGGIETATKLFYEALTGKPISEPDTESE